MLIFPVMGLLKVVGFSLIAIFGDHDCLALYNPVRYFPLSIHYLPQHSFEQVSQAPELLCPKTCCLIWLLVSLSRRSGQDDQAYTFQVFPISPSRNQLSLPPELGTPPSKCRSDCRGFRGHSGGWLPTSVCHFSFLQLQLLYPKKSL